MKRDWSKLRAEYLKGGISLRQLAAQSGVSFSTLGKRARREHWAVQRQQLGDCVASTMVTSAVQEATERGKAIGALTAAQFVATCTAQACTWLSRLETLAGKGELDAQRANSLISAWKNVVSAGRESYGLTSSNTPPVLVNVALLAPGAVSVETRKLPATTEGTDPACDVEIADS